MLFRSVGDVTALLQSSDEETQRSRSGSGAIDEAALLTYTSSNQYAYLGVIRRMAAQDGEFRSLTAGWIWGAFFFPFYWLLYRKMWLHAVIFLGLNTFAVGMAGSRPFLSLGMLLGLNAATAIMGKSVYIARAAKRLRAVQAVRGSLDQLTIARLGGASVLAVVIALIVGAVALIFIVGSVAAFLAAHPELVSAFPQR